MITLQRLGAKVEREIRQFASDRSGATAVEYAMIAAFISIVIVGAVTGIGSSVKNSFTSASNGFN